MNRFRLLRDTYTSTSNMYGMFTNNSLYNDLDIHLSPPPHPASQSLFPLSTPRIHASDNNVLEQIFQNQTDEIRIYGNDIYNDWLREIVRPKKLDRKYKKEFIPTKSRLNVMNK